MGEVSEALRVTLAELDLSGQDQAASALAGRLAELLDAEESGRTAAELAGKLLATLESLGATPAARKALLKGVPAGESGKQSALDEFRARRERRG